MTKYLNLNEVEICADTLQKLIDFYNTLEEYDHACIMFSSGGGSLDIAFQIVHVLNEQKDRTVLCSGYKICSAALWIFVVSECDKIVYPYTSAMWHLASAEYRKTVGDTTVYQADQFHEEHLAPIILESAKVFMRRIGLSKKEQKVIIKGEDMFFCADRVQEFLDKYHKG